MPYHITMNDAATKITDWVLSRENLTEERKAQICKGEKYNVLTKLFNASSVLLIAGVVSAIFLAISSAFVFLVLGLFLRNTTEKELEKSTLPVEVPQAEPPAEGMAARGWAFLRATIQVERQTNLLEHALHRTTEEKRVENIFANVGLPRQEDFVLDEVILFDFPIWKNSIPIPGVVVQRQSEESVRQEEPAASSESAPQQSNANAPSYRGGFANLIGRLVGAAAAPSADANNDGDE